MRPFLFVGCGGSGGQTLAYLMDELRSELDRYGLPLPQGWEFVHIDVPTTEEPGPDSIGNVQAQGGHYFGCGPQGGRYPVLDQAVTSQLGTLGDLGEIATWAPRNPANVTVPINEGAGQYRAIGRAITLQRAHQINGVLTDAYGRLSSFPAKQDLTRLARTVPGAGDFQDADPVVVVVSSMSGGAGASMALDVCRMLNRLAGELVGVFMFSGDVFDSFDSDARSGVRSNSLAMLGEIAAAQFGTSRDHDNALFKALGVPHGYTSVAPFARVFPIGRYVGMRQTLFGDGEPNTVYRGLARGLRALVLSQRATMQYTAYDLGNQNGVPAQRDSFGWGVDNWSRMPWGAFGFASLSMGRERYREYAAQRLARFTVDRLLEGHKTKGSSAVSEVQLDGLVNAFWPQVCRDLQLPLTADDGIGWLQGALFPTADQKARELVGSQLSAHVPNPTGRAIPEWLGEAQSRVAELRPNLYRSTDDVAYARAYEWHQDLATRTEQVTRVAVCRYGVAYARDVLDRVEAHVRTVLMPLVQDFAQRRLELTQLSNDGRASLSGMKGTVTNGQAILESFLGSFQMPFRSHLYAQASVHVADVLPQYLTDLVEPLRTALTEAQQTANRARSEKLVDVGLARLSTEQYPAWPAEDDPVVPERFSHAVNEVLLIDSSQFDAQFRVDITNAVPREDGAAGGSGRYDETLTDIAGQVIAGVWRAPEDTPAPDNLLDRQADWRPRTFLRDPTGHQQNRTPQQARFRFCASPVDLLDRAQQFVKRRGASFDQFVSVSLSEYIGDERVSASERQDRAQQVVDKFAEALTFARPLTRVYPEVVRAVHSHEVLYRYKFSDVPFGEPMASALRSVLDTAQDVDPLAIKNLDSSLAGSTSAVTRIDVFGSYANYSPLVFESVLKPVAEEWARPEVRDRFWKWRRTRPLRASLPMSDAERQAMVTGWFIGEIVGQVRVPAPPYTSDPGPAEVWDPVASRWLPFPHPMLTPPQQFIAPYDWLPAVLESVLIAIARSAESSADQVAFASLRPYALLRGLYDRGSEPAGRQIQRSAETTLLEWLRSGSTASGSPSRLAGQDVALDTVEQRADAAVRYLDGVHVVVGTDYLAPGQLDAPGGGVYSTVTLREQASWTPIYRDLAPDVYQATKELHDLVRRLQLDLAAGRLDERAAEPVVEQPTPRDFRPPSMEGF